MPCIPISVSQELATQISKMLPTTQGRNEELGRWLAEGLQARQKGIPIQLELDWAKLTQGVLFKVEVTHKERSDEKAAHESEF